MYRGFFFVGQCGLSTRGGHSVLCADHQSKGGRQTDRQSVQYLHVLAAQSLTNTDAYISTDRYTAETLIITDACLRAINTHRVGTLWHSNRPRGQALKYIYTHTDCTYSPTHLICRHVCTLPPPLHIYTLPLPPPPLPLPPLTLPLLCFYWP